MDATSPCNSTSLVQGYGEPPVAKMLVMQLQQSAVSNMLIHHTRHVVDLYLTHAGLQGHKHTLWSIFRPIIFGSLATAICS